MNNYLNQFIEYLDNKKLSKNTIEAYRRDIEKYISFLEERRQNIIKADKLLIMSFVQSLQKDKQATSSILRNIISIRGFYKFLIKINIIEKNPTDDYELPKIKRNLPEILNVEEVDKLLSLPDIESNIGKRDRAMMELMYAAGLKVSELLNLNIFDINLKLCYIKCTGTKNRERVIPIGNFATNCLQRYLEIRQEFNYNYKDVLFLNSRGQKMTRQGFWKIMKAYAKTAKIDKDISSSTLRHSFAVHLLENGADLKSVQELLGYSDLAAAQIYTAVSKKNKLLEVYKKTHPRA